MLLGVFILSQLQFQAWGKESFPPLSAASQEVTLNKITELEQHRGKAALALLPERKYVSMQPAAVSAH